jgi:hypothetical protein
MGKRGPKAKGEFTDKSAVLSTRISAELRAALEKEVAAKPGLTLSREIEHRLRRSFDDDKIANEGFGTRRNRALMKIIALTMQTASRPDKFDAEWLDDPWLFHQTLQRINLVLLAIRPAGAVAPPIDPELRFELEQVDPMERASQMWDFIQKADSSLPLRADPANRVFNRLKVDLGEVVQRPKIVEGTVEEAIKAARMVAGDIEKFGRPSPPKRKGKRK